MCKVFIECLLLFSSDWRLFGILSGCCCPPVSLLHCNRNSSCKALWVWVKCNSWLLQRQGYFWKRASWRFLQIRSIFWREAWKWTHWSSRVWLSFGHQPMWCIVVLCFYLCVPWPYSQWTGMSNIYLSIHPSIHPSIHLSIYLSIYLKVELINKT